MSSRTMVSRKEEPESLRTARGRGFEGWSRGREERMSLSGASPARTRRGKMSRDEESLALLTEQERDKSGDGCEGERDSCVEDVDGPAAWG